MSRQSLEVHSALPEAPREGDPLVQLCAFRVGEEKYVLDLRRIEEILRVPRLARVPQAPSFIDGVMSLRGAVLPAIDLRKRFGLPPPPPGVTPKCMICRLGRDRVAVLVDGAPEVVRVRISELRPAPRLLARGARPYVIGACGAGGDLKLLLDLKALCGMPVEVGDSR
jgi:purine-binding chemotaxis protein CheW